MNLILCGMMGSGKTTVGLKIAEISGRKCYDTDGVIVERYGSIAEIFARYGEARFRALEKEIVRELTEQDQLVLSTGGGLVLKQENVELLKNNGKIVYLRARAETLCARLQGDRARPLLQSSGETLQEKVERLLAERAHVYERVADCVVDVDEKTPEKIATEIVAWANKE